jgi:hypothetical protein
MVGMSNKAFKIERAGALVVKDATARPVEVAPKPSTRVIKPTESDRAIARALLDYYKGKS